MRDGGGKSYAAAGRYFYDSAQGGQVPVTKSLGVANFPLRPLDFGGQALLSSGAVGTGGQCPPQTPLFVMKGVKYIFLKFFNARII